MYVLKNRAHFYPLGQPAPRRQQTVSERLGWKISGQLVSPEHFVHIDRMLIEPSRFQRYFVALYRADTRFSKATIKIVDEQALQRLGLSVGSQGFTDKQKGTIYLLSRENWFGKVPLSNAVHEAVHCLAAP